MDKFEKLEALISELKISDSELKDWYENRAQEIGDFIPTELPLVYRKGTEFTVENGLNLKRKEELWGIQLLSGVMVALMCGSGNNVLFKKACSMPPEWGKLFIQKIVVFIGRFSPFSLCF